MNPSPLSEFSAGPPEAGILGQIDASRLMAWEANAETGAFTYVSSQAVELFGYELDAWYAPDFWIHLIHPEDRAATVAACHSGKEQHEHYALEYRALAADGRVVWVQDIINVDRSSPDETILRGYLIDITSRKNIEATLERLHRREGELARAERINTMAQMAAELAHELNQPLYAIGNFAETCLAYLQRESPGQQSELRGWIENISQQARRAGDIFRRIHSFVRQGELDVSSFALNDCVRETLRLAEFAIHNRGVEIRCNLADGLPKVVADRLLIEQVLLNLVRNALEALDEVDSDPRIMTLRTFLDGEGSIGFEVRDTGAGFCERTATRLFEPFFTTKPDGTGLGLAFCRSTLEAHSGRVVATNLTPRGASFQFLLPAQPV